MRYRCWDCRGVGWVSDGQPEDGMMTGRMKCPTCNGRRYVTDDQVLSKIRQLLTPFETSGVDARTYEGGE